MLAWMRQEQKLAAGFVLIVFYRSRPKSKHILVKVLKTSKLQVLTLRLNLTKVKYFL